MATFKAKADFETTADGELLILKDSSNYTDNDQGYTVSNFISRRFEIRNLINDEVVIINLNFGELEDQYEIDKDKWLEVTLILQTADTIYEAFNKLPLSHITQAKLDALISRNINSCNYDNKMSLRVQELIDSANYKASMGNGYLFEEYIKSANNILNNLL